MKKRLNQKSIPKLNKVLSLPNISTFHPKKNNISKHNVSSTTKISEEKNLMSKNNSTIMNSQILPSKKDKVKILLLKIGLKMGRSQHHKSKSLIMPASISTRKDTFEIMEHADSILKERIKNHDRDFAMRKKRLKSIALKMSKRICRKNYMIESLKQRRTDINDKEYFIEKSLKKFEWKLEHDKKRFVSFIDEIKEKQAKDKANLIDIKNLRLDAESTLEIEERQRRTLEQMLHRKIKELYLMKDLGSFVHKILGSDFPFNCLPPLKNDRDPEKVAETFIQIFDSITNYDEIIKELGNTKLFFKKCNSMEEEIITGVEENKILEKEIIILKKSIEKELKQLKFSKAELESDYKYIINETRIVKNEMKNYKLNDDEDFDMYLSYIEELGSEIDSSVEKPEKCDKKYLNQFVSYSRDISKTIKKTDDIVNEMISCIDNVIEKGDKKDKELMLNIIFERKSVNKKEKQLLFKEKEEELKMKQKLKMMEKEKKVIIKGKKVIMDYPITSKKQKFRRKKIQEIKYEGKKNIELEYSFSDEDGKKNSIDY